jgi:O-antigen ligase
VARFDANQVVVHSLTSSLSSLRLPWLLAALVWPALPVLLFSSFLPAWAPAAALVWLGLVFGLRALASRRLLGHTVADLPLLLLALTLPVGFWASADRAETLARTFAFAANLALFATIAVQRPVVWARWSGWVLLGLALGLSGVVLMGTVFTRTKLPFVAVEIYDLLPGGWRPFWNLAGFNPNLSGGLIALFLPPAVMLALGGARWPQRLLASLAVIVVGFVLILSQSRGALLGVAVGLAVSTALYHRAWAWMWWGLFVLGAAALLLLPSEWTTLLFGVAGDALGADPVRGRVELWSRAIYMVQDFGFTGVGLGLFEPVTKVLYPTFLISLGARFLHPHNFYLQVAAEMGVPALIAHLAMFMLLGAGLLRQARKNGAYRTLALGLLGTLAVFLVHGLVEVITYAPRAGIVVWGLFGLMAAVGANGWADDEPESARQ